MAFKVLPVPAIAAELVVCDKCGGGSTARFRSETARRMALVWLSSKHRCKAAA